MFSIMILITFNEITMAEAYYSELVIIEHNEIVIEHTNDLNMLVEFKGVIPNTDNPNQFIQNEIIILNLNSFDIVKI